jgi:hypothetical protein
MQNNTLVAKDILIKNGYTCVLVGGGEEHHSTFRGVKPLLDFLQSGKCFKGFSAADKTVGLGAAHLYVLLGVESVWAKVISTPAKAFLEQNGIHVLYETEAPFIINRQGDGRCPIETAVNGITDPAIAYDVIIKTLENLKNG